ncbi:molybdopterin-dependent oxidoreductase [bacterium]|nr:molybdopterin-dependent oxidoreductase [bacterium]
MNKITVYSICGSCSAQCPIEVEVQDGRVRHIWGNPHSPIGSRALCPKGAAAKAILYDDNRPQYPMMRDGARGSGNWKRISWDEALDRIAERLAAFKQTHGAKSLVLTDHGGPFNEFQRTFLAAYGSPNAFDDETTGGISVHNAHMSMTGLSRDEVVYDYENCHHLLSFGRAFFDSVRTDEASQIIDLISRGGRFSYIDVRWNNTAAKATDFHVIRPHTDYSVVMGLIHVLLKERLYNVEFVERWVNGLDDLRGATVAFTPEFAESMAGFPAKELVTLARQLADAAPHVIVHPGHTTAWGRNDYYFRRALYALNALLGSYEAPGGLILAKSAADAEVEIRQLSSLPKEPDAHRVDGIGDTVHHLDKRWGLLQTLPAAIQSGNPYPLKAFFAIRHDPLRSLPDREELQRAMDMLELIVTIDDRFSDTAWRSDFILPEPTFLERTDNVIERRGVKPALALRQQAVAQRFDSKPRWWIFRELANRLNLGHHFPYETIDDHIAWQLEGSGIDRDDFTATGLVELSPAPILHDRGNGLKFKKRTGKIELACGDLKQVNVVCWAPCANPQRMTGNHFKVISGQSPAQQEPSGTGSNPLLDELTATNPIRIPTKRAHDLNIADGDAVLVHNGTIDQRGVAKLDPYLSDDAIFLLRGFRNEVPEHSPSRRIGVDAMQLYAGALEVAVGGNCPLTDSTVTVEAVHSGQ